MKQPKTYRDLDYNEVIEYAEKKDLNTDSHENYRVAIMLFQEKYSGKKSSTKHSIKRKR
jgi:hypothetical protein